MTADIHPLKARYIGYTKNTENHGDETLLWLIRDLLAPEIEVVYDGSAPYDIALLGGGTLINQSPWLIDLFKESLDKSKMGKGIIFGSGVGDMDFWGDHFHRWVPLLERCDAVGVRGPHSLALLKSHDFSAAQCIGDPYLWIVPPVRRQMQPRHIGVNLGSTNNSLWGTNDTDFLGFMTDSLQKMKKKGFTFAWFSVWSQDLPLLEEIRSQVAPESAPVIDARSQTMEAYSALADCEIFIGEKLHACAMAAISGVPFIAMEYQPKILDFAASLDMDQWVISTAERDPDHVVHTICNLLGRRTEVKMRINYQLGQLRQNIQQFVRSIKSRYLH